jgi:hypothetical protein
VKNLDGIRELGANPGKVGKGELLEVLGADARRHVIEQVDALEPSVKVLLGFQPGNTEIGHSLEQLVDLPREIVQAQ